jgi:hypothetical protein
MRLLHTLRFPDAYIAPLPCRTHATFRVERSLPDSGSEAPGNDPEEGWLNVGRLLALMLCVTLPVTVVAPVLAQQPAGSPPVRALVLSDQARRFLFLQYRGFHTEFMGCMIGEVQGGTIVVRRIAPADVDTSQSTATWVVPQQTCESAGWTGTVGMIHSHPTAERCWYFFPGTQVPSSDGHSFLAAPYPVDAIMCGGKIVWISRDLTQREMSLTGEREASLVSTSAP